MVAIQYTQEKNYLHKVYRNITCLGILLHAVYAIMFAFLNYQVPLIYNIFDVLFYFSMVLVVTKLNRYSLAVSLIHIESMLFCILHVILFGWNPAFYIYLIAMASLVYFCPFKSRYIPYLYSLLHFIVFFILYAYSMNVVPIFMIDKTLSQVFFVCNALSAFIIILYVAYVSKASASVGRKELIEKNEDLQQLTNYDQMTGLYSKSCLKNRYLHYSNEHNILSIGDIDDFKLINDTYGHICGDIILKELAEQMRARLDPNIFLCRWGGEEFVFVFTGYELKEAKKQLEDFCHWIEQYEFQYQDHKIHLTMTFGVAQGANHMILDKWIEQADQLLYQGKKSGKNKVLAN